MPFTVTWKQHGGWRPWRGVLVYSNGHPLRHQAVIRSYEDAPTDEMPKVCYSNDGVFERLRSVASAELMTCYSHVSGIERMAYSSSHNRKSPTGKERNWHTRRCEEF